MHTATGLPFGVHFGVNFGVHFGVHSGVHSGVHFGLDCTARQSQSGGLVLRLHVRPGHGQQYDKSTLFHESSRGSTTARGPMSLEAHVWRPDYGCELRWLPVQRHVQQQMVSCARRSVRVGMYLVSAASDRMRAGPRLNST